MRTPENHKSFSAPVNTFVHLFEINIRRNNRKVLKCSENSIIRHHGISGISIVILSLLLSFCESTITNSEYDEQDSSESIAPFIKMQFLDCHKNGKSAIDSNI